MGVAISVYFHYKKKVQNTRLQMHKLSKLKEEQEAMSMKAHEENICKIKELEQKQIETEPRVKELEQKLVEQEGKITEKPRGENGFGFDSIFELDNGKTLAELTDKEKNVVSSRKIALNKLRKMIDKL